MRKNSIFTILTVILPLTVANADEITNLTLDTPVDWPVSAFNMAVAMCFKAQGTDYYWDTIKPDENKIGYFTGRDVRNRIRGDKSVSPVDFEPKYGQFVLQYVDEYRHSKLSLRKVLDVCMNTIGDAGVCARFAQNLVYYSQETAEIESNIMAYVDAADKLFEDGPFYVKAQVTYSSSNDGSPKLVDDNLYLKDTNLAVGKCDRADPMYIGCDIYLQDYASWRCGLLLRDNRLSCKDYYISYIESAINDVTITIKDVENLHVAKQGVGKAEQECVEKYKKIEISRLKSIVKEYESATTTYSYSLWIKAGNQVSETYESFKEFVNRVKNICGVDIKY
ncbi:MAG: hypothetical protein MJ170_04505 [Alphaproteobacteria bacterium]|nr:hypothetical protein [Alphaproteobacteria bacterium]